jgi:hypothetical protein
MYVAKGKKKGEKTKTQSKQTNKNKNKTQNTIKENVLDAQNTKVGICLIHGNSTLDELCLRKRLFKLLLLCGIYLISCRPYTTIYQ